jgi:hypothetical protein
MHQLLTLESDYPTQKTKMEDLVLNVSLFSHACS